MSEANVKTVQEIYGAFGRGDVPAILERVTEGTTWDFNGGVPESVAWHAPARGKEGVAGFIGALVGRTAIEAFEPREFIHSGPHVVAHVRIAYVVKKTGKRVDEEQLHWWTIGADGRVERLRHFEDTAQVIAASAA